MRKNYRKSYIKTPVEILKNIPKSKYPSKVSEGYLGVDDEQKIPSDVLGSYTGTAEDGEPPVQDADDL